MAQDYCVTVQSLRFGYDSFYRIARCDVKSALTFLSCSHLTASWPVCSARDLIASMVKSVVAAIPEVVVGKIPTTQVGELLRRLLRGVAIRPDPTLMGFFTTVNGGQDRLKFHNNPSFFGRNINERRPHRWEPWPPAGPVLTTKPVLITR